MERPVGWTNQRRYAARRFCESVDSDVIEIIVITDSGHWYSNIHERRIFGGIVFG